MRIINILTIVSGTPHQIESFAIYEEQLSQYVVDEAEKIFKQSILDNYTFQEQDNKDEILEEAVENGYFDMMDWEVYLIWSNVD